jgi:phosphohistidine phosphatase
VQVYIVRHAEAEPGGPEGDAGRRLTPRGQLQARAAAAGLRALEVRVDRLLTSPLRRAFETAALLAEGLAAPAPETREVLDGRAPAEAILAELADLAEWAEVGCVALVGHMPVVAELVALSTESGGLGLATASVARVDFAGPPAPGAGRLRWLRSPEQLGDLAGA